MSFLHIPIVVNRVQPRLLKDVPLLFHEISFHPGIDYLLDRGQIQQNLFRLAIENFQQVIVCDSLNYFVYIFITLDVTSFRVFMYY